MVRVPMTEGGAADWLQVARPGWVLSGGGESVRVAGVKVCTWHFVWCCSLFARSTSRQKLDMQARAL